MGARQVDREEESRAQHSALAGKLPLPGMRRDTSVATHIIFQTRYAVPEFPEEVLNDDVMEERKCRCGGVIRTAAACKLDEVDCFVLGIGPGSIVCEVYWRSYS